MFLHSLTIYIYGKMLNLKCSLDHAQNMDLKQREEMLALYQWYKVSLIVFGAQHRCATNYELGFHQPLVDTAGVEPPSMTTLFNAHSTNAF